MAENLMWSFGEYLQEQMNTCMDRQNTHTYDMCMLNNMSVLEWRALMAAAQMMWNQNTHDAKRHF